MILCAVKVCALARFVPTFHDKIGSDSLAIVLKGDALNGHEFLNLNDKMA